MYYSQIQLDNSSSSHLDLSQYCLHYPSERDGVAHLRPHRRGLAFSSLGPAQPLFIPLK